MILNVKMMNGPLYESPFKYSSIKKMLIFFQYDWIMGKDFKLTRIDIPMRVIYKNYQIIFNLFDVSIKGC